MATPRSVVFKRPPFQNPYQQLYDPAFIGSGLGAVKRQYEIARLADELRTSVAPQHAGGGGGFFEDMSRFVGRAATQIGESLLMTIPSTFMMGGAAGLAARKAVGLGGGSYTPAREMAAAMYHGVGQDIHNPYERPGYLTMDVLNAVGLGALGFTKTAAVGRALRGRLPKEAVIPAPTVENIRPAERGIRISPRLIARGVLEGKPRGPADVANALKQTRGFNEAIAGVEHADWGPEMVSPGGPGLPPQGTIVWSLPKSDGSAIQIRSRPGRGVHLFRVNAEDMAASMTAGLEGLTDAGKGIPVAKSNKETGFQLASFFGDLMRRGDELQLQGHPEALPKGVELLPAFRLAQRSVVKYLGEKPSVSKARVKTNPLWVEGEEIPGYFTHQGEKIPNQLLADISKSMRTRPKFGVKGLQRKYRTSPEEAQLLWKAAKARDKQLAEQLAASAEGFTEARSAEELIAEKQAERQAARSRADEAAKAREEERKAKLEEREPEKPDPDAPTSRQIEIAIGMLRKNKTAGTRALKGRLNAEGVKFKSDRQLVNAIREAQRPIEEHIDPRVARVAGELLNKQEEDIAAGRVKREMKETTLYHRARKQAQAELEAELKQQGIDVKRRQKPSKGHLEGAPVTKHQVRLPRFVTPRQLREVAEAVRTAERKKGKAKAQEKAAEPEATPQEKASARMDRIDELKDKALDGDVNARRSLARLRTTSKTKKEWSAREKAHVEAAVNEVNEFASAQRTAKAKGEKPPTKEEFRAERKAPAQEEKPAKAEKPPKKEAEKEPAAKPEMTVAERRHANRMETINAAREGALKGNEAEMTRVTRLRREANKPGSGWTKPEKAEIESAYSAMKATATKKKAEAAEAKAVEAEAVKAAKAEAPPTPPKAPKAARAAGPRKPKTPLGETEVKGFEDLPRLVKDAVEGDPEARQAINAKRNFIKTHLARAREKAKEKGVKVEDDPRVQDLENRLEIISDAKAEVDDAVAVEKAAAEAVKPGGKKLRGTGATLRERKEDLRSRGESPRQLRATAELKPKKGTGNVPDESDPPEVKVKKTASKPRTAANKTSGANAKAKNTSAAKKPKAKPSAKETGEFNKTQDQMMIDEDSLRESGVPEADWEDIGQEIEFEFRRQHEEAQMGRPMGTRELHENIARIFQGRYGDTIGTELFENWSSPKGGATVPWGKRFKEAGKALVRAEQPGVRLHKIEVIDIPSGKRGHVTRITTPVFTIKSRSPVIRGLSNVYHVLGDPEKSFIPKYAGKDPIARTITKQIEKKIEREKWQIARMVKSLHDAKALKSEAELKKLMNDAYKKWEEEGKKHSVTDYLDSANQFTIIATLFTKPAYLSANLLGQLEVMMTDHSWNPLSMYQSSRLANEVFNHHPDLRLRVRALMMEGAMSAFGWNKGTRGPIGRNVNRAYRGLASEGFSFFGYGLKKPVAGVTPKGLISIRFGKGGKVWNGYEKWLDSPWRENALMNEFRRAGYRTPEDAVKLLTNPKLEGKLLEVSIRANKNAIEYGALGDFEREWLRRVVFFYPWIKASSKWTARQFTEHPVQMALKVQSTRYTEEKIREGIGLMPGFMTGTFPISKVSDSDLRRKLPLVYNPMSISTTSSAGDVARTLGALLGDKGSGGEAGRLANWLNPAVGSLLAVVMQRDPFTDREIKLDEGFSIAGHKLMGTVAGTLLSQYVSSMAVPAMLGDIRRLQRLRQGYGDLESTLMPMSVRERIGRWLGPGFSVATTSKDRNWFAAAAATYRINPKVAREKYFAEQRDAASKYDREIMRHQEYLQEWKAGWKKAGFTGPLPAEVRRAMLFRAKQQGNLAVQREKIGRELTPREKFTADMGTLAVAGLISEATAIRQIKWSLRWDDRSIEKIDDFLLKQYSGKTILTLYKSAINERLRSMGLPELTSP